MQHIDCAVSSPALLKRANADTGQPHYKIFAAVAFLLCEILLKISHIFPAKGETHQAK